MSWPFAVVLIVALLVVGGVFRSRRSAGSDPDGEHTGPTEREKELEAEVEEMRERIQVLERIATSDREARRLSQEIEELRDDKEGSSS